MSLGANAQITTRTVAKPVKTNEPTAFDSTSNFLGKSPALYVGQQLYLLPKDPMLRKFGYDGFVVDYTKPGLGNKENTYQCCDSYGSMYEALQGKYFTVEKVIPHPEAAKMPGIYGPKSFLQLKPKEGDGPIYYEYSSISEYTFPFLVVGYFEKQKRLHTGKKFVLRGRNWKSNDLVPNDLVSGVPVSQFTPGKEWKCVDVSVDEKFYLPSLILENSAKQQIALPLNLVEPGDYEFAFPGSVAAMYQKTYGPVLWAAIVAGTPKIGMTKQQARLAWGSPEKTNQITTAAGRHEQWVYKQGYLSFEGDKLTAIQ
jgi:hypothetical protein